MKIVIIGGGISGCTAYLQLKKHLPGEHSITIYEAYDTNKDRIIPPEDERPTHSSTLIVGGGLGIGPNGLNVLKRLDEDLLRDIVRDGYVVSHGNMKNKNGRILMRMSNSSRSHSTDQPPMNMLGASRHLLWRCLRVRIPDSDIVTKRVASVIAKDDGLNVVHFVDDSPSVEADLVIGADGVKGLVKRALFPEDKEDHFPPRYEGLCGVGGFIPADEFRSVVEKGSMNFVFGGNGFFGYFFSDSTASDPQRDSPYHISEAGESISWWSTYAVDPCPNPKTLNMDDVMRQLRERHAKWGDPVIQKIIQSARVENMYPTWTSPPLPTWERDGVVLVGDAAHALPPTSGQGSSQALEDVEAFVLFLAHYYKKEGNESQESDVLKTKRVIQTSAKQYMELRKPHVTKILENAQRMQNTKRDMGVVQEYLMYCVFWLLGFFPSVLGKSAQEVFDYNVAEHVKQMLAHEDKK